MRLFAKIALFVFRVTVRKVFFHAVERPHVGYMNIFVHLTVPTHLRAHYVGAQWKKKIQLGQFAKRTIEHL